MDFVPCRYDIRERVIKIDSFEGVSPRYVIHQAIRQKQVYITRAKNPIETKGKSEQVFSQNNCVSERGFVALINQFRTVSVRTESVPSIFLAISPPPPSFFSLFGFGIPKPTHSKN